jgi:hypothetical protein
MGERGNPYGLIAKMLYIGSIAVLRSRNQFDGYFATQLKVLGAIHFGHPSHPK